MAFKFKKANCVALGTFNIYIVRPEWLVEKQILPKGVQVVLEFKLDEPGFRISCSDLKVNWQVMPTRIITETSDADVDCGQFMAQLLRSLPETPLVAVGNNTYYSADTNGIANVPMPGGYPVPTVQAGCSLKQRTFHIGVQTEDCVYNLQLAKVAEGAELLVNAHGPSEEKCTADFARKHAQRFMDQRRRGLELSRHHLKVEFDV